MFSVTGVLYTGDSLMFASGKDNILVNGTNLLNGTLANATDPYNYTLLVGV